MIIKTKFNKNDQVWYIDYDSSNRRYYVDCFVVGKIMADYNDSDDNKIFVSYSRCGSFYYIFEQDCFSSKEEAEKECEKRNKKEKR